MAEEKEDNISDAELTALQKELDDLEIKGTGVGSTKKDDNVYRFNRDLLIAEDTTNIGNLKAQEVGESRLSLRGCLHIARYCRAEGLKGVGKYFEGQGDDITRSSLSKEGFQQKMFRTDIKKQTTDKPKSEKKGWFGKRKGENNE